MSGLLTAEWQNVLKNTKAAMRNTVSKRDGKTLNQEMVNMY